MLLYARKQAWLGAQKAKAWPALPKELRTLHSLRCVVDRIGCVSHEVGVALRSFSGIEPGADQGLRERRRVRDVGDVLSILSREGLGGGQVRGEVGHANSPARVPDAVRERFL